MSGGLVLSRKRGEAIITDGPVEIRVIDINKGQVKLHCSGDQEVMIMREELLNRGVTRKNGEFKGQNDG